MRSLFVDDINGARPSHRYFDKQLYRERHSIEIERFGPNGKDYKKTYDWYEPNKRHVEPIQRKNFPVKLLNYMDTSSKFINPEDLSQSLMLSRRQKQKVSGKVTEISHYLSKSTVLSGSGQQSLSNSTSEFNDNPYFPHMYVDKNSGIKNKWRGTRHWEDDNKGSITIPKELEIVAKTFRK